jgi:hypothetical protein
MENGKEEIVVAISVGLRSSVTVIPASLSITAAIPAMPPLPDS